MERSRNKLALLGMLERLSSLALAGFVAGARLLKGSKNNLKELTEKTFAALGTG